MNMLFSTVRSLNASSSSGKGTLIVTLLVFGVELLAEPLKDVDGTAVTDFTLAVDPCEPRKGDKSPAVNKYIIYYFKI